jgi:hypothetical protein
LLRLLDRDNPVEGHCGTCDEFWSISARERRALAMALRWTPGISRQKVATAKVPDLGKLPACR